MAVPDSPKGGILADDMDLGKTLTMISAIAMSLNEARAFASSRNHVHVSDSHPNPRRASSTLVIVPSAGMLLHIAKFAKPIAHDYQYLLMAGKTKFEGLWGTTSLF